MSLLLDVMKQHNMKSQARANAAAGGGTQPPATTVTTAQSVMQQDIKPRTTPVVGSTSIQQPQQPAGTYTPEAADSYDNYSLQDLVPIWQQNQSKELAAHMLKRLDKTVKSAMTSYAGQISDALAIPAANIVMQALQSYDPKKGAAVQTHVFNALRRLNRVGAQRKNIMHVPQGVSADQRTISKAVQALTEQLGRQPDVQQISQYTGLSKKRVSGLMSGNVITTQSGAQNMYQNKDVGARSDITDQQYMQYVHSTLGHIDRKILQWSTGLYGQQMLSVNQIAARLGISAAAVSQRRAKIQAQLQQIRGLL